MMVHYTRAQSYLEGHGRKVFVTAEGLLSPVACVYMDGREDKVEEELEVFPIDDAGMVCARSMRVALGY